MRTLVFAIAVLLLVPCVVWAQTHGSDVTIDGDLNVGYGGFGVGSLHPAALAVQNSGANAVGVMVQNSDTGYTSADGFFFGLNNVEDARFGHKEHEKLSILTDNKPRITVTADGYVGINQPNPARMFVVNRVGGSGANACFQNNDTGSLATNGFVFGIDGNENAILKNYHNSDMLFSTNGGATDMILTNQGRLGIGTVNPATLLEVNGEATVDVLNVTGSDVAELFDVRAEQVEAKPGMVVSIDPENPGALVLSSSAYDRNVAGIISGAGTFKPGMLLGKDKTSTDLGCPIALSGRTYCYVDATSGPVLPGDLLTTSDVPGHAMKVTDYAKAQGAIIGKAMSSLENGRGLVMVLVCLQ